MERGGAENPNAFRRKPASGRHSVEKESDTEKEQAEENDKEKEKEIIV
jgi:hypothetical protein